MKWERTGRRDISLIDESYDWTGTRTVVQSSVGVGDHGSTSQGVPTLVLSDRVEIPETTETTDGLAEVIANNPNPDLTIKQIKAYPILSGYGGVRGINAKVIVAELAGENVQYVVYNKIVQCNSIGGGIRQLVDRIHNGGIAYLHDDSEFRPTITRTAPNGVAYEVAQPVRELEYLLAEKTSSNGKMR